MNLSWSSGSSSDFPHFRWVLWHQPLLLQWNILQITAINWWVNKSEAVLRTQTAFATILQYLYPFSESMQSVSSITFCNRFVKCPQTQALASSRGRGEFKKATSYCQLRPQWWCGLRYKHREERLAAFFLLQTQSRSLYNPATRNHGQTVIHDSATQRSIRCCKAALCWFM